jgi:hypothetical protein
LHQRRGIAAQRAERLVAGDELQMAVEDPDAEVQRVERGAHQLRATFRRAHTTLTLRFGSPSMWHSMTSPLHHGPTFSGVPE